MESKIDVLRNLQQDKFSNYLSALKVENHAFKKVYVSFGSKFNEPFVNLKTPDDTPWFSNALDQMCPTFIRYRPIQSSDNMLVVVIDDFRNDKLLKQNILILEQELDTLNNTRICLLDKLCDTNSIKWITENIIDFAEFYNIDNAELMICNFIKYKNTPNVAERDNQQMVPKGISSTLNESSKYTNCLYEWFGYHYGLHTMIYNYNMLNDKPYLDYSVRVLQQIIQTNSNGLPIHFMKNFTTANLHVYTIMGGISSLEICHDKPFKMNVSLYEFMKSNNIIHDDMDEVDI